MRALDSRRSFAAIALLLLVASAPGCAHRDWRRAVADDTASAYHQFLREHPGSGYATEARARLALVRLRSRPTLEGFHAFAQEYANTGLVEELRPHVEVAFFDQARGIGTPEAYESFLADFEGGALAARARGNLEYLRNRGFDGDPARLGQFAKDHPESDFAAEALRSVATLRERALKTVRRAGLQLEVDPSTPGAERLERVFAERAAAVFRAAGLALVPLDGRSSARPQAVGLVLRIAHREGPAQARLEQTRITESSWLAETEVTLRMPEEEQPIWQETFSYRAPLSARRVGESILFDPDATSYWAQFFVPVATWQTHDALRSARELPEPPVALDAVGARVVVLFQDGSFQLIDFADPLQPALLAEYRRARDLARFEGVRVIGNRVAVFGQDGLEIVALDGGPPRRERVWTRDQIGSPHYLVDLPGGLALGGNRGLQWIPAGSSAAQTLVPREILGLARAGEHLVFSDGASLYSATPAQLIAGRVASELRFGRGFAPGRVRVNGASAVVLGSRGVVSVDVSDPNRLALRSRIEMDEVGAVRDALFVSGRVFLLGGRGLQVVDRSGEHVSDAVDVSARQQLAAGGRHLVLIGEREVEVVDATPFVAAVPAAGAGEE